MSALPDQPMPLLCELGWHRPDPIARWNDGYYFSKCARCGRDLVRTAFGQWQVPKGYRVVWQQRPPETREEIALVPETAAGNGAVPEQQSLTHAAPAWEPEQPAPAEQVQAEPVLAAEAPAAQPSIAENEAPAAPAARPEPEVLAAQAEALTRPPNMETVQPAEPSDPPADEPLLPLNGLGAQAQPEAVITIVPEAADQVIADDFPIDDLLHQSNDTGGHEVHEAHSASFGHSLPAPLDGRQELPIAAVLRHLHATPLPPTPAEDVDSDADPEQALVPDQGEDASLAEASPESSADEPSSEDAPAAEPVAETAGDAQIDERSAAAEGSDEEPRPHDEAAVTAVAEEPAAEAQPAEVEEDEVPAILQRDLPEPHFDPHVEPDVALDAPSEPIPQAPASPPAPPERVLRPIQRYSSDWDFMKEEEEDPITSFWEQTEPAAAPAPEQQPEPHSSPLESQERREEPPVEAPVSAPAMEAGQRHQPMAEEPAPTTAEVEQVQVASEEPRPIAAPIPIAPEPPQPSPRSDDPAPRAPQALDEPIPAAQSLGDTAHSPNAPETIETPPWVDQMDEGDGEEEAPRGSRLALMAFVSAAILALVATIASQSRSGPVQIPPSQQSETRSTPEPQPAKGDRQNVIKPSRGLEPVDRRASVRPDRAQPGRTGLPALPATLPGRGQAFVSASVLQCRSAPVDRSAPVRKLVRGAEVQILAREGDWLSIAHKGRQCWAAARFLSAAEPW